MGYEVQRNHPLVLTDQFASPEDFVIFLMHQKAYDLASSFSSGRNVLDWGCNNGYGLPILARSAKRVGGVDTNEACVAEARRLHPEFSEDIWLYDGVNIPVTERFWDIVVSFQVIEHVPNVKAYVDDIVRVMKDTGIALFTTPNRLIRLDDDMKPWNEFHVTEFSAAQLASTLRDSFRYVQIFGMQGDPEILNVERKRCSMAREMARLSNSAGNSILQSTRTNVKRFVKSALPSKLVERLRTHQFGLTSRGWSQSMALKNLERFSTSDLCYTEDSVDDAVDLLAVCSNEQIRMAVA